MDDSRKYDLEELMNLYKHAPSQAKRDELERIITKIMRESGAVRERRQELIEAIRHGDRRHVRYVQEIIRKMDMDQYGGKETVRA
jgi:hypothetical protein